MKKLVSGKDMKPEGIVCDRNKLTVTRICNHEANEKQKKHHYLRRKIYIGMNVSYRVDYEGVDDWGVVMYGYPVFHTKYGLVGEGQPLRNGELVDMVRLWLPDDFPMNSESCAIGKTLKLLKSDWEQLHIEQPLVTKRAWVEDMSGNRKRKVWKEERGWVPQPRAIIAFADSEIFHVGTVYKASNFTCLGWVRGRKATPGKGQGRWTQAKKDKVGQVAGLKKNVYLYLMDKKTEIAIEELRRTYKQ